MMLKPYSLPNGRLQPQGYPYQAEASRWWEAPCSLSAQHHWDFLPQVDSPSMKEFHVTGQEEILALALVLQHCMETLEMPPGVLCEAAWDLLRCMAFNTTGQW